MTSDVGTWLVPNTSMWKRPESSQGAAGEGRTSPGTLSGLRPASGWRGSPARTRPRAQGSGHMRPLCPELWEAPEAAELVVRRSLEQPSSPVPRGHFDPPGSVPRSALQPRDCWSLGFHRPGLSTALRPFPPHHGCVVATQLPGRPSAWSPGLHPGFHSNLPGKGQQPYPLLHSRQDISCDAAPLCPGRPVVH